MIWTNAIGMTFAGLFFMEKGDPADPADFDQDGLTALEELSNGKSPFRGITAVAISAFGRKVAILEEFKKS